MPRIIIVFAFLIGFFSCNKEKTEEYTGTIEDFWGRLDGCVYLIQLDNGKRLEPTLNSSGVSLVAGRRMAIKYRSKPSISICMAGETVEIITLRYL
jgi:hypothetical protein